MSFKIYRLGWFEETNQDGVPKLPMTAMEKVHNPFIVKIQEACASNLAGTHPLNTCIIVCVNTCMIVCIHQYDYNMIASDTVFGPGI